MIRLAGLIKQERGAVQEIDPAASVRLVFDGTDTVYIYRASALNAISEDITWFHEWWFGSGTR